MTEFWRVGRPEAAARWQRRAGEESTPGGAQGDRLLEYLETGVLQRKAEAQRHIDRQLLERVCTPPGCP